MKISIIHSILLIAVSTLKGLAFPEGTGADLPGSPRPGSPIPVSTLPVSPHPVSAHPVSSLADSDLPVSSLPDSYNESYALLTDRNMYAVGEKILFSAFNISPPAIRDACWSRVIYVHLLKTDGTSVAEDKFPLACSGASGFLYVPDDILTGNYYLCAYTKWMRNFSPALFSFVPLTIINPFNPELDRSGLSAQNRTHQTDSLPPELSSEPGIVADASDLPGSGKEAVQVLECIPDKAVYRPGEEIHLSLHYPGSGEKTDGRVCLSAAREGLTDTMLHHDIHSMVDASWSKPVPGYLPEINGLSLSGRVLAGDPPEGIENARVELSVFGDQPNFMAVNTNPDGSFCYHIDSFSGSREMFISCRHPEHPKLELRIDNDFTLPRISFPAKPFSLNDDRRRLAREIMLNMQLDKRFSPPDSSVRPGYFPGSGNESIHGLKGKKLLIDDYIELPNLKEVFIELFPEVQPVTGRKKTTLNFKGTELTRLALSQFEPLILVDQVPVYDLDKLLALPPKRILSIEVIDDLYVLGKTTYGGFINIISKNGDMGGIDLPGNSMFFRYQGFPDLPGNETPSGDRKERLMTNDPEPESSGIDFGNCLHWEPDLSLVPGQTKDIHFHSIDQPGMYRMVVRGIAEDGIHLYGQCTFLIE